MLKRIAWIVGATGLLLCATAGCREKQNVLTVETPNRKVEVNVEKDRPLIEDRRDDKVEVEIERKGDDD